MLRSTWFWRFSVSSTISPCLCVGPASLRYLSVWETSNRLVFGWAGARLLAVAIVEIAAS